MTGIEELQRQHAQAQATAEAAAQQIAEHEQRIAAEQAERRAQWDAGLVAEYSRRARDLDAEAKEARAAFRAAVVDSPLVAAWIADRAVRWRKDALVSQMHNSLVRLGREREMGRYPVVEYRSPRLLEDIVELADAEAQERGIEEGAELDRQREAHVTQSPDAT